MRKSLWAILLLVMLTPAMSFGWEASGEKILSKATKNATLDDYYVEEVQDVPSSASFIVGGKKLTLVADPEDIEKWLKNRKGRKFQITYGKVHGWLGDGETDYEVLMDAKLLK